MKEKVDVIVDVEVRRLNQAPQGNAKGYPDIGLWHQHHPTAPCSTAIDHIGKSSVSPFIWHRELTVRHCIHTVLDLHHLLQSVHQPLVVLFTGTQNSLRHTAGQQSTPSRH
jgi:hypothetical protein